MPISTESIQKIVADHPCAAAVFQRFDIDLCGQTTVSLDAVCAEAQLCVDQVLDKLEEAVRRENGMQPVNPECLSTERLIRHIVRVHHQNIRQQLPGFVEMARKLAATHGDHRPEMHELATLVRLLHTDMLAHIQKEEQILFPYISQLDQELPVAQLATGAGSQSLAQRVRMMKREHDAADHILHQISRLTNDFKVPADACGTHSALIVGLKAFAADSQQHVHLEDDILFPRAIGIESNLGRRS